MFRNILVAIRREPEAARVLEKVARLVTPGCRVTVLRVVYDEREQVRNVAPDQHIRQRTLTLQAEEEALEALLDPYRGRFGELTAMVVWNKRFYVGVLDVARELGADLVVKTAEVKSRLSEVVRTPDDWHLLRESAAPVLLLKAGLWVAHPTLLAAVDVLDEDHASLSATVLGTAASLAGVLQGEVQMATAYPALQPWPSEVGAAYDYSRLRASLLEDIDKHQRALQRTLALSCRTHAVEGEPSLVLERLAEELAAELVVIGTAARTGVSAIVIGNTSEALLHDTQRDVLVLRDAPAG